MNDNPYQPPQAAELAAPRVRVGRMFFTGLGLTLATAVIGGLLGALVGLVMGLVAPGYYRAVIIGGSQPGFDPVGCGVGLGLTQGLGWGTAIGAFLFLTICWYRSRIQHAFRRIELEQK